MTIPCPDPDCTEVFASENGAVMHYLNKPTHTEYKSKPEVYQALGSSPNKTQETDEGEQSAPAGDSGPTRLELPTGGTDGVAGAQEGENEPQCPECGSGKYDLLEGNRAELGVPDDWGPDDARICVECWPDEVVVYEP